MKGIFHNKLLLFLSVACYKGFRKDPDSGDCVKCPRATYSDTVNATSCTSCPDGQTTYVEGNIALYSCYCKFIFNYLTTKQ